MKALDQIAIPAGTQAMTSQNGPAIASGHMSRCAAIISVTNPASLIGTLKIQGSNDPNPDAPPPFTQAGAPALWADIPNLLLSTVAVASTATVAVSVSSTATSIMLPTQEICFKFVRAVWTYTSGTGNIGVNLHMTGETN